MAYRHGQKRGSKEIMRIRMYTLFGAAAACCATAAMAQQKTEVVANENAYSVARETTLQGKVVAYSATSSIAPMGAHVQVQTAAGVVDVHLGNAHLLTNNHLALEPGD